MESGLSPLHMLLFEVVTLDIVSVARSRRGNMFSTHGSVSIAFLA